MLIIDNASFHESLNVKEFVESHSEYPELVYLPPYSQDLNPIERVWKHLRYPVTQNSYFESLEAVIDAIMRYLKMYA